MKKFVLLFVSVWLCATFLSAQKEYKQIRTFLKNSNPAAADPIVQKCIKDSVLRLKPETYQLAAQVQTSLNDVQNTKLFLKQPYDTVAFFTTIYGIFDNLIICDSLERKPDSKGRVKVKNRSSSHNTLKQYYPNLFNAGLFFLKKKNYADADKYFSLYINAAATPIFIQDSMQSRDPKMPRAAFWSMASCYELKKYNEVFKFNRLAMRDTANLDLCLQYKSLSYQALNDLPNMVIELKEGLKHIPKNLFYFSHLADYYNSQKQYETSLKLCDSLISKYKNQLLYKFAKCGVLFNMKRYDDCIALSKEVIQKDTTNADAYFYLASCYYNQATDYDDKIDPNQNPKTYEQQKAHAKQLYEAARPYMEKYRSMKPDDSARWATPLYRIYLSLNLADKFKDIDALLKKADSEKKAAAAPK